MADSFTTKLKFVKPEVGGSSGGWGTTINSQLIDMLEEAIAGVGDVSSWSSNNADISSISNGTTSTGRAMILTLSAGSGGTAIGGAGRLTVPGTSKVYIVINNTAYAVTVGSGGSGGVAVPAGKTMLLVHNGTQIVDGLNEVAGNLAIGGTLTVDGATTMSGALNVVAGNFALGVDKFTIAVSDGDTAIAGTLGVTGAVTGASISANPALAGSAVVTGAIQTMLFLQGTGKRIIFTGGSNATFSIPDATGTAAVGDTWVIVNAFTENYND